MEQVIVYLY